MWLWDWGNGFDDGGCCVDVWMLEIQRGVGLKVGWLRGFGREVWIGVYLMMKTLRRVVVQLLVLLKVWISFCVALMKLVSKVSLVMFDRMLV